MRNTDLILACLPSEAEECRTLGLRTAILGYTLSDAGRLLLRAPKRASGEILVLSDDGSGVPDEEVFDRQLAQELKDGRFSGIFADFDGYSPRLSALIRRVEVLCIQRGLALYVPVLYAPQTEHAFVLIGSDVAAGSFEVLLAEQKGRFGERLALELVPLRADFRLPSQGRAQTLSEEALDELLARGVQSFFSQELCASYFTYRDGTQTHFVVYDDARSLSRKIGLAREAGVGNIFGLYGEVRALLPDILLPEGES